jgi:AraC-like DNA-binding protein
MRELTIVASGVRALLELAVSKGASRSALVERSVIDPEELSDRDNRVAFSKYVALMRAGQELCNDPALALHFGEAVDVTEISLACGVGGFETIDEAFAQVNRYSSLGVEVEGVGTCDRYQLRRSAGQLWIVDARRNPNDFPELTESSFARMVCSTRRTFGDVKFFKEVHFTHAEPAYRAEYERIFRVPVVFGSGQNALRIDEQLLSGYRLPPSSQYVTGVLKEHAESLLKKLEGTQSTRGRVERMLIPLLHGGDVGIDKISSKLGLSRQTLFRKLKAEGVTFEQVLDELRCSLAHHYLNDRKVSVKKTAYLVGFSDPGAFSRAFKRWTGRTPGGRSAVNQPQEMVATS